MSAVTNSRKDVERQAAARSEIAQAVAAGEAALNAQYVACPACDAIWRRPKLEDRQLARCGRCHAVLTVRKPDSANRTMAALVAALILYLVAISFPFLSMEASGLESRISVIDAVRSLWRSEMYIIAIASWLLILVFPLIRMLLLMAVIGEIWIGRRPSPFTAKGFRLAQDLEPWAMAEIFLFGVIVSLVKVGQIATISIGPSFWALCALIVALTYVSVAQCRDTVWSAIRASNRELRRNRASSDPSEASR